MNNDHKPQHLVLSAIILAGSQTCDFITWSPA